MQDPRQFRRLLGTLYRQRWVVYAKPPFGGARQVHRYLGRYTHRVAISNRRLLALDEGRVTFCYKDYADGGRYKQMTLDAEEFIRRFLLHVLPKGFVRIRHYGLLAGRNVDTKLAHCRRLLGADEEAASTAAAATESVTADGEAADGEALRCPHCHAPLHRYELPPAYLRPAPTPAPWRLVATLDSS